MATEANEWGLQVDPTRPHLGGFYAEGDPSSWYPDLWRWLVEEYGVRSMVDVGCGSGAMLRYWRDVLGVEHVLGIDGIECEADDLRDYTITHDYTSGPLTTLAPTPLSVDLAWSCEFVEHVEERYVANFVQTFLRAELVLMTHAVPGQGGHHHVNCQTDDYWIGVMAVAGFDFDPQLTAVTRELAQQGYYARTGLAFKRRAA